MNLRKGMVLAAMAGVLGGCATGPTVDQKAKMAEMERRLDADRMVQAKIAESTASIANTLQMIERIERGPAPRAGATATGNGVPAASRGQGMMPQTAVAPAGAAAGSRAQGAAVATAGSTPQSGAGSESLDARLRIQWRNGSAEELLRSLAKQMNIPFKVEGERRALPPVSIVSENESMRSILSAVGRQIDRDADIVFNRSQPQPVLELRYRAQ